ncbi:phytoene desaturase family protein [Alkalicoccus luteus]|uniref:Phytoene desaturase n=1 Tax=Alkalicoccus luteus TaxID=1237094 RepID=A0A969PQZ8_9BACI|nr:phytoene desaturase family protein [Alkalicoccus luteus]NJP38816.1 phytoene desaturase [Alkalicoccus luteus]
MKTVVCGGGIGGMISALYENAVGHNVTILEKKPRLGGRLAYHDRGSYKVDEGPTIVLLPDIINSILKELDLQDRISMTRINPLYPMHFQDGTTLLKMSGIEQQQQELMRFSAKDADAFPSYMKDMEDRFNIGSASFLGRPFLKKKDFWTGKNIQHLIRLKAYQSVKKQVKSYFKDKRVQEAFMLQTLYIGGAPDATPAMYSLVPFSEHFHGIWYVNGGYARLAEVLQEAIEERGIEVRTGTSVNGLTLSENNSHASAVQVNEEEIAADRFIMNGEFPSVEKMVHKRQVRSYEPSSGCLLLYFGLNKPLDTNHVHSFYMGGSLDKHMQSVFKDKKLEEDPSFYVFQPSLIDASLAPEGHAVAYVLVPVPSAGHVTRQEYLAYAENIKQKLIDRVDANLTDKIVWSHVRTPHEAKMDGLFQGGSFGIAPTLFQSGVFRPQVKPFEIDNVYAVGASVHPGGGIPIVMQGAKVLNELLRDEEIGDSSLQSAT